MPDYRNFLRLSPEYEEEYVLRYGKQPKFIPVNLIDNSSVPKMISTFTEYSRVWIKNSKHKERG